MSRYGTVALLGRPNAGKSTLINALLGDKVAIVSDKPQTTRHRVAGVLTEPRGQMVIFDLPGVHRPLHRMNVQMMHVITETLREVDVIVQLFDAAMVPGAGESFVNQLLDGLETPVVLVPNKLDLNVARARFDRSVELYTAKRAYAAVVPISALSKKGLPELRRVLFGLLPVGNAVLDPTFTTTQSERYFIAELIREALLERVARELPFTSAVLIEMIEESDDSPKGPLMTVYAQIIVERESQKRIIVGHRGQMIRDIGTAARKRIQALLGVRVHLALIAKARPRWRDDHGFLAELDPVDASMLAPPPEE